VVIKSMRSKMCLLIALLALVSTHGFSQAKADSSKEKKSPVVFINGKPASDTLRLSDFERMDYIKGKQAIELMGPRGKDGVYLISSDGRIPVYGEVSTESGNKIKDAEVVSGDGSVLTKTNRCGTFFISAFKLYDKLIVKKKGFADYLLEISKTEVSVKLVKKRK
jgi:hypothetical protein